MAQVRLSLMAAETYKLPHVCLCCGQPSTQGVRHRFYYDPAWLATIGMLLPWYIRYYFASQFLEFPVPVCSRHKNRLGMPRLLGLLFALSVIPLVFGLIFANQAGATTLQALMAIFTVLYVPVGLLGLMAFRLISPRMVDYDTRTALLVNVSSEFAQGITGRQLPRMPGQMLPGYTPKHAPVNWKLIAVVCSAVATVFMMLVAFLYVAGAIVRANRQRQFAQMDAEMQERREQAMANMRAGMPPNWQPRAANPNGPPPPPSRQANFNISPPAPPVVSPTPGAPSATEAPAPETPPAADTSAPASASAPPAEATAATERGAPPQGGRPQGGRPPGFPEEMRGRRGGFGPPGFSQRGGPGPEFGGPGFGGGGFGGPGFGPGIDGRMPGGNAGGVEGEERESYRPGPGGPFPPQTAQITRPDQVQVGDEVWAQFAGTWHKSKVLEIAGAQVKIHRLGWNAIVDRPYPLAAIRRIVGGGSAASLPAAQPVSEEKPSRKRTWTDSTGQFKVEAEFVELKDNFVSLKKSDGAVIRIPLDKLSADDQKFAQQLK